MKTNAVRLLEASGVAFEVRTYDASDGQIDALSVAAKVDIAPDRLFKTLVARSHAGNILVFCIPGTTELDLKKAATASEEKSVALVRVSELKALTGYERGGCSPFGMKHDFPVWVEESVEAFETVLVSGGRIGLQIEIASEDLLRLARAGLADLV